MRHDADYEAQRRAGAAQYEYLKAELSARPISEDMIAVLQKGTAELMPWSNVAGGYGADVWALQCKGLMNYDGDNKYSINDAGRAELERHRVAKLAAIGVYEG